MSRSWYTSSSAVYVGLAVLYVKLVRLLCGMGVRRAYETMPPSFCTALTRRGDQPWDTIPDDRVSPSPDVQYRDYVICSEATSARKRRGRCDSHGLPT